MAEFKLRFQAGRDEFVYYPDLMVSCRPESIHQYYLSDPTIVIEVLSPSTERTDRREKLQSCSQIESLEEFVLVAQSREELIFHRRVDEWKPEVIGGAGAMAEFRSLDLVVPMARVYDGVQQAAAG
jgi:Uma2 family endonuclease